MRGRARVRDLLTSGLEVAGAVSVVAGVNLLLGQGAAFVAAGVFALVGGYLLGGEPE